MPDTVALVSIATAVPPHRIDQREAALAARESFASRYDGFDHLARVFDTAGIRSRYLARPLEWYMQPRGWSERNAVYLTGAEDLFVQAATEALAKAGVQAAEIDTIVTISSTGLATPSVEARVADQMGFRSDVERVPVFGLGCAGGVTGLGLAARLASARPGSFVLLVAVELCSVAFRLDKLTKENIVATALFGDGAAACVLKAGGEGLAQVEASGQHTWPNTLDIMGWSVDDTGLGVIFDRSIPPFATANMGPAVSGILQRMGLSMADVDRFACHPGGAKVVTALEIALSLDQGTLDHERTVLADYGNMSAPTALFVLDRLSQTKLPPRTVLTAMGPGFSASCVSLVQAA